MSEHQMIRHRCIRATMRIGALLLLLQLLLQLLPEQVPPFPFHQTVAVMKMLVGNRRHILGIPIRRIDALRANRSLKTTTTLTLRTKTTTKTKTKTIVAFCPIQVPVPSPPFHPSNKPFFPGDVAGSSSSTLCILCTVDIHLAADQSFLFFYSHRGGCPDYCYCLIHFLHLFHTIKHNVLCTQACIFSTFLYFFNATRYFWGA